MNELDKAYNDLKLSWELQLKAYYMRSNAFEASRVGRHDVSKRDVAKAKRLDEKAAALREAAQKIIDLY